LAWHFLQMASTGEALCSQCPWLPQPTLLMVTRLLTIAEGFPSECFCTRVQKDILNCGIIIVSHFQNINSNSYKEKMDNLTFILSEFVQLIMLLNDICEVPNLNHGHDTEYPIWGSLQISSAPQTATRTGSYIGRKLLLSITFPLH
jgi:hypothetical protein